MTAALRFDPIRLPPECEKLRKEVRAFLADEIAAGTFDPHQPQREDTDAPEFSRRVGERGWIGMTWPKKYGGHERSFLERYVVTEEMRVANAPTRRFFVADRQSGPVLLKYAPEHIKMDILPRICRGEVCFAIGMSEPNSGSDLFAAKTKATKTDGGCPDQRHQDLDHVGAYRRLHDRDLPHLATDQGKPPPRPDAVPGRHEAAGHQGQSDRPDHRPASNSTRWCSTDAFVPDDHLLGEIDGAWKQATSELAYERSRPGALSRNLLRADRTGARASARTRTPAAPKASAGWWRSCTPCGGCRSRSPACCRPARSRWSKPRSSRTSARSGSSNCRTGCASSPPSSMPTPPTTTTLDESAAFATMTAPKLTIQGGTTEVLRGIIARGLGLR